MTIHIEIGKSWREGLWKVRIGDIEGASESFNFGKEDVLKEIEQAMDNSPQYKASGAQEMFAPSPTGDTARLKEDKTADTEIITRINRISDLLYGVNSKIISLRWIGMNERPTEGEIVGINALLGTQIKELRKIVEELEAEKLKRRDL